MISVRGNAAMQRIDMKVDQQVNEEDLKKIVVDLKREVTHMRPGWVMASDLRGLTVVNPSLSAYLVEVQKTAAAAQPRKIGTLVDSSVMKVQLQFSNPTANYKEIARRFDDEAQWREWLAQP